jgi:hypothetical protein
MSHAYYTDSAQEMAARVVAAEEAMLRRALWWADPGWDGEPGALAGRVSLRDEGDFRRVYFLDGFALLVIGKRFSIEPGENGAVMWCGHVESHYCGP